MATLPHSEPSSTTIDAFIGGRVEAVQPARGHHRSGLDAVLLASALDADTAGRVIDMGAGAGVAGMVLAARAMASHVMLAERESELVDCARIALQRPANTAFAGRIQLVETDLLADGPRRAAGLLPSSFDHAILNPPFHDAGRVRTSPNADRARAHVLAPGGLDDWFRAAAALVRPGGTLSVILPAARLADLFSACTGRFGDLTVLPIQPRPGGVAIRVLARTIKGSKAPLRLLSGLVLHERDGGAFTPPLAAILRDGAALREVHPGWAEAVPLAATPSSFPQLEGSLL